MARLLRWSLGLLPFLVACAGSDGHPPVPLETPAGGSSGVPMGNDAGKGNKPASKGLYEGGFINIPDVSDIALDEPNGVLYVGTTKGGLAIVNLADGEISSQKLSDSGLTGMDFSPDGKLLAVGEHATDPTPTEYGFNILDLEAKTVRQIMIPVPDMHLIDGTQSVAFTDNEHLLVSASWRAIGYSQLLRVNLNDESAISVREVLSDTMLQRSADGSVIGYVEPVHGEGALGEYDIAAEEVNSGETAVPLRDLSLNANGSLMGLPSIGLFTLWTPDGEAFSEVGAVLKDGRDAMASVFSPSGNSVYVAWSKSVIDGKPGTLERYSADGALDSEGVVSTSVPLATSRESGYTPARMKISSDGTLLFLTVEKGINVYLVEP